MLLEPGTRFVLTTDGVEGTSARVSTSYRNLPADVRAGERILLDDGLMERGVTPIMSVHQESLEKMLGDRMGMFMQLGVVDKGDLVVVIFGTTLMPGATNILKVHEF